MLVRLWLFTPRQGNYPEGGTFDTSVFDSIAKTCSDPHQEIQFEKLLAYANARGETLQQVQSAAEAFAFCSPKQVSPPVPTTIPPPSTTQPPNQVQPFSCAMAQPDTFITGIELAARNGLLSPGQIQQLQALQQARDFEGFKSLAKQILAGLCPPQHTKPSDTPPPIIPPDKDTNGGFHFMPGKVYRLILESAPGRIDTGASYPLCSRSNPDACKPIQFADVETAVNYAKANNEIPVRVNTADEAWAIMEGSQPIDEANIITGGLLDNPAVLVAGLIGILFVAPKLFKKGGAHAS